MTCDLERDLERLLKWWDALPREGDGLPHYSHIDFFNLKAWLGDLGIVTFEAETSRYRVRLAGTNFRDIDKGDSTGKYLDEIIPGACSTAVLAPYERCRAVKRPVADRIQLTDRPHMKIERLLLPFGPDLARILVGMVRTDREIDMVKASQAVLEERATVELFEI